MDQLYIAIIVAGLAGIGWLVRSFTQIAFDAREKKQIIYAEIATSALGFFPTAYSCKEREIRRQRFVELYHEAILIASPKVIRLMIKFFNYQKLDEGKPADGSAATSTLKELIGEMRKDLSFANNIFPRISSGIKAEELDLFQSSKSPSVLRTTPPFQGGDLDRD